MAELILPIITEFVKDPIFNIFKSVKRHVCYPFNYDANVHKLQTATQELENRRAWVQQTVNEATRKGDRIYENVTNWLTNSSNDIAEANRLIHGKERVKQKKCLIGFGPDLIARYQLSRNADKKASTLANLENEQLGPVSFPLTPRQIIAPSVFSREALQSRISVLRDVMEALEDSEINMIGVYGMGGVGKTTLAKEVHRQAQEDKLFGVVIMVSVSQSPEIGRIQKTIAEVLNLRLEEEDLLLRAYRLNDRLLKEDKKILIILDDVWNQLLLEDVGIPFGKEGKVCKILLTSRRIEICRAMGANKNLAIDVLSDDEAWSLFQMTAADARDPKLPPLATQVAKKCSGLPLLIISVATDLRNKEADAWKDKLRQLSEFDNEDTYNKVLKVLEWSYQNLPTTEIKSFFLLCGLIGQSNIRIQSLLEYAMGLGLFKRITTVADARIRMASLIHNLKAERLLLDGDMDGFVKMHDVVRDTAMSIALREQHAFFGISGLEVRDWPREDCTRISLPFCDIKELPDELICPKAEILLLVMENFVLRIPDSFFNRTRQLKVVDLSGMYFPSLPSSLGFLANIHTLCLHRCQVDDITLIGELRQLEILSLADSHVVELPRQIEQLSHLKLLDLTDCSKLERIPANVISKLLMLEELYMKNSFTQWEHEGANNNGKGNISLAELKGLSALTTLEVNVTDPAALPKLMISNEFQNFRILIGDNPHWFYDYYKCTRTLKLRLETSILSEPWIRVFLKNAELIDLQHVMGIRNFLYDLDIDGFPLLKYLCITDDQETENFIKPTTIDSCPAFPVLESLELSSFERLNKFYDCRIPPGSFSNLITLGIQNCKQLTYLFASSTVRCFSQLQDLQVIDCPEIEFIVICDSDDEIVEFTHLRLLKLIDLPKLKSFCQGKIHSTAEQHVSQDHSLPLFGAKVSLPNLEDLSIEQIWHSQLAADSFCKFTHLFASSTVRCFSQLQDLRVIDCPEIEFIVICDSDDEIVEFTHLRWLGLTDLPKLKSFCQGKIHSTAEQHVSQDHSLPLFGAKVSLPNLQELIVVERWPRQLAVDSFSKLTHLFTSSTVRCFSQLRDLRVVCRPEIEFIVICDSDDEIVEFTHLRSLALFGLLKLKSFCQGKIHSTADQHVSQNHSSPLFDAKVSLPNLKTLALSNCSGMNIWHSELAADSFSKLMTLNISDSPTLLTLFPSSVLPRFLRLKTLKLTRCTSLQEIYLLHDLSHETVFKLKHLEIRGLSSLRHIWSIGSVAVTFPNLQSVEVWDCNMERIFPASIARELVGLEKLEVHNCRALKEIIAEIVQVVETQVICFKFRQVLEDLEELESLYPGIHPVQVSETQWVGGSNSPIFVVIDSD